MKANFAWARPDRPYYMSAANPLMRSLCFADLVAVARVRTMRGGVVSIPGHTERSNKRRREVLGLPRIELHNLDCTE